MRRSVQRILLVGFMGSGKSSTGRELAARLEWDFFDFDAAIEEATGETISEIFRGRGEPEFRRLEAEVAQVLLARSHAVLSSGGGWPAAPGRMETLAADTLSVWLKVSPERAVQRIARDAHPVRPLLECEDPVVEARRLLRQREGFYARASLSIDTEEESPREVAERIIRHLDINANL